MCSDCEDDEPLCSYCWEPCYGSCDDPDTCPTCWVGQNDVHEGDIIDDQFIEDCANSGCECGCHGLDFPYDFNSNYDVDAVKNARIAPYDRKGVLPFLKLPGELRSKVYGYAFLQDGNQRLSPYHRGTIHTAILRTCRLIYKEAGKLPLTLNTLNFASGLYTLSYLGFYLMPGQKNLLTSIHIEFYYRDFTCDSWYLLFRQLATMPITHLGLTVKGPCPKDVFLGHKCFVNRFAAHLKGIKTLNITLGYAGFGKKTKDQIQEEMRKGLINGYKPKKSNQKRVASSGHGDPRPTKQAKKSSNKTSIQTKLMVSPKSARLAAKPQKAELGPMKQYLQSRYNKLEEFAKSIDTDAASVKIRLEDARKAVQELDGPKFEQLAQDILKTLEQRHDQIVTARHNYLMSAKAGDAIYLAQTSS
ncbi:hypothetical protein ACLMJK_004574 [Lecanora helva]